jgi:hypothetical protein
MNALMENGHFVGFIWGLLAGAMICGLAMSRVAASMLQHFADRYGELSRRVEELRK